MRSPAAAVLLALTLTGCGGGDLASPSDDGATVAAQSVPSTPAVSGPMGDQGGALRGGRVDAWADVPAVTGLDPDLLAALRDATEAARDEDGIAVEVTSGWRSREYQQELLDEAVARYGSPEEAARWVATPDTSLHVSGDAVDVGPTDAAYWMAEHGARFGLCQTYANEVWHYELVVDPGGECPAPRADGTA